MTESGANVRPYRPGDEGSLVRLWNQCLRRDLITLDVFTRKVLLDPNFDARGALVAEAAGQPMGFVLAIARKVPLDGFGLQPDRGWITVFFVAPGSRRQGTGTALLTAALDHLRERGVQRVLVAPYAPNYFQPGVDVDAYPEGVRLLERLGFVVDHNPVGMGCSLLDHEVPPDVLAREATLAADGLRVRTFQLADLASLLDFLTEQFPGDWPQMIRNRVARGTDLDEILVAEQDGVIVGYAHVEGERFGPFATHPAQAGRGIGTILFHRALERMRQKGRQNLWLAWTHGAAQRFYERNGLTVRRTHALMRYDFA